LQFRRGALAAALITINYFLILKALKFCCCFALFVVVFVVPLQQDNSQNGYERLLKGYD
jgi:hypothetical protein